MLMFNPLLGMIEPTDYVVSSELIPTSAASAACSDSSGATSEPLAIPGASPAQLCAVCV